MLFSANHLSSLYLEVMMNKPNQSHGSKMSSHHHCGPGYASPAEAMLAEREKTLYTVALYTGTGIREPDYLATVDADPASPTYSQVIHRLPMPNLDDELHHFGWNACSSCHGDPNKSRRFLIVPGFRSGRIHIVDTVDQRAPSLYKVIEPAEVAEKTNLSAPHTVHCLADGTVMIAMLGDAEGNSPGGFLLLDDDFNIAGRWAAEIESMRFNYDFWYQPRHNTMVSSGLAAPNTYYPGFNLDDVAAGLYSQQINVWDWQARKIIQPIDLGEEGLVPLEVRFLHDPDSTHAYVGAALSSNLFHLSKSNRGSWRAEKVVDIPAIELEGWPFPVPSLMVDIVISMDDRYLYLSNWLHGDVRQYDISDPAYPRLTGQVWCGGVLGKAPAKNGRRFDGGPNMIQLSLDGKRLYVTTSLLSSWDNQFYPEISKRGSTLVQIDCDTAKGGMKINQDFYVDFGNEPTGPARAHEIRYPGGDCTSDIWL
jgi:methanethiol oxidase